MSSEEAPITHRIGERPSLRLARLRGVSGRELVYRFVAGALTSIVAGLVTLTLGPRAGGVMLAFPAILAASLTLIEEQEDSAEAREDARGAVIGGCALAAFAAVAAFGFGHLDGGVALVLAAGSWALCALGGYLLAWFR
jgi:hypothetical protein